MLRPVRRRLLSRAVHTTRPDHSSTVHVSGPAPDRILILGTEIASGFGARTDDLTFPGHLARALGSATGRGVDVDVTARLGLDLVSVLDIVTRDERNLARYDVIALAVGAPEVLSVMSERAWRRRLDALLLAIHERIRPDCAVVLVNPNVDNWAPYVPGAITPPFRARCENWATVAQSAAAGHPRTTSVSVPDRLTPAGTDWHAEDYRLWGAAVATHIAQQLPCAPRGEREEQLAEAERQRAVDGLRIGVKDLDGRRGREMARILRSARDWFATSAVAFTVLDGDDLVVEQALGMDSGGRSPRSESACDTTVRRPDGFVVPDMQLDGRYPAAARHGLRFYAGYRVEATGGHPVGALCLYDTDAREFDADDMRVLRDLATRVSAVLQS
ncbi:MAG: GAF domain-containing protein [Naasia sp.]